MVFRTRDLLSLLMVVPLIAQGNEESRWVREGSKFFDAKDWAGLRNHCLAWSKAEPLNKDAWTALGAADQELKRYAEAIQAYRMAVKISPNSSADWHELGVCYGALGNYSESMKALQRTVKLDPRNSFGWNNLGLCYASQNNYSEAAKAMRRAVNIDPDYGDAWHNLGTAYLHTGDRAGAREAGNNLIRLGRTNDELLSYLGPR